MLQTEHRKLRDFDQTGWDIYPMIPLKFTRNRVPERVTVYRPLERGGDIGSIFLATAVRRGKRILSHLHET